MRGKSLINPAAEVVSGRLALLTFAKVSVVDAVPVVIAVSMRPAIAADMDDQGRTRGGVCHLTSRRSRGGTCYSNEAQSCRYE
jgi:hypothetical protein